MKSLHRSDLYSWDVFDESRNVDFHGLAWVRPEGNVLVDPVPLSAHDLAHLDSLGGAAIIVVTNSDHVRDAAPLAERYGARVLGPRAEAPQVSGAGLLADGDEVVPGLVVVELDGSKTPGELALVLEETTLITGDLIRAHRAGSLMLLPDAKLQDRDAAIASLRRLAAMPAIRAVLVGDGFQVFRQGHLLLRELLESLE